ncbi:helix-turn-helix transcriptional regulator [Ktedonobacter racemifer]|uniref:helix-turn-helix transcriptional regulator n=1 Tax=Ktedonobacter racemifer TaxID=363277 RepID=UPI0002F2CB38|nr:LuxR C-terminal-related transcriptional regulator [Ktedonobacter racemifer]
MPCLPINAGHSNNEIAAQLIIALSTIKSHVHTIYSKLGEESRTQVLAQARRHKLL